MYEEFDEDRFNTLNINIDDSVAQLKVQDLQKAICSIDHDENRIPDYYYKIVEELGELGAAMRKDLRQSKGDPFKGSVEEEVTDVIYYAVCIANLYHIDLNKAFYDKEELNCKKYNRSNMFERFQDE